MNYEDAAKAMLSRFDINDRRNQLSEDRCVSHIAEEAHLLVARKYGYQSAEEMDLDMNPTSGKWLDYMKKRSKHLPIRSK